jgi:hypothetical protein
MNRSVTSSLGVWSAAAVLALTLLACSQNDDMPTPPGKPAAPPVQTDRGETNSQAKLNLYVDCYNRADHDFHGAIDGYAKSVNIETGPTGRERHISIFDVRDAQACQKAVERAKAMQPAMPELDQAAAAYVASLTPLEATINEAYTYYKREKFQDDNYAQGKALHKSLIEQAKTFTAASEQFSSALDDAEDAQQQAELQRMEKEGDRNQDYYHLATQVEAKQLVRLLTQNEVDLDKADAMLATFGKTIGELKGGMYVDAVYAFRKAAKERAQRLREKTPYSMDEESKLGTRNGWIIKGSPDQLLHYYNDMISANNRL